MFESTLSRRTFVAGSAAAAGAAGLMGLFAGKGARADEAAGSDSSATDYVTLDPASAEAADSSIEADVVVVGTGVTGMIAATAAAQAGAATVAIDRAPSIAATNACSTAGIWAIESSEELKYDEHLTQEWAFDFIWSGTHYQTNAGVLRNLLRASGPGMNLIIDAGMPLYYAFADGDLETTGALNMGGHVYTTGGLERGEVLQGMMDAAGVDCHWGCEVTNLLVSNGVVCGVRMTDAEGATVDVNAGSVIVCTGGFIQNLDLVAKYYGGARMYGSGNPYNDGAGVQLCMAAGAQMGKNYSTSINESGACNASSSDFIVASDYNETPLFSLPLFGGLFLNSQGVRFMDESKMASSTMYCGEPLLRESTYYVILDQAAVDTYASQEILSFMDQGAIDNMAPAVQASFEGVTLSSMPEKIEQGIEEGWVWKADSLEELGEATGMGSLAASVAAYNEAATTGDTDFYKPAGFITPVETAPFYAVQLDVAAWLTLGGIKCDECCRALDAQNTPIEGLFVAGADADLWSVPYYEGGSAQGFCVASGYLAGLTAAGGDIREA